MSNVFVVQERPNHDLAPAMKFGEMKVLLPSYTQIAFSTAPTIRTLRHKLRSFSDVDYLLLAGDPVAIGLACSVAAFFNNGRYTALKWDRRERMYIPVKIDVTQKGESDE
jgi:hypothetical protein